MKERIDVESSPPQNTWKLILLVFIGFLSFFVRNFRIGHPQTPIYHENMTLPYKLLIPYLYNLVRKVNGSATLLKPKDVNYTFDTLKEGFQYVGVRQVSPFFAALCPMLLYLILFLLRLPKVVVITQIFNIIFSSFLTHESQSSSYSGLSQFIFCLSILVYYIIVRCLPLHRVLFDLLLVSFSIYLSILFQLKTVIFSAVIFVCVSALNDDSVKSKFHFVLLFCVFIISIIEQLMYNIYNEKYYFQWGYGFQFQLFSLTMFLFFELKNCMKHSTFLNVMRFNVVFLVILIIYGFMVYSNVHELFVGNSIYLISLQIATGFFSKRTGQRYCFTRSFLLTLACIINTIAYIYEGFYTYRYNLD